MRIFYIAAIMAGILLSPETRAQSGPRCANASSAARLLPLAKTTLASPALDSYDVRYVKLDLALSNLNTSVSGSVTTTAVSKAAAGLSSYVFELSSFITIDSIRLNGALQTATSLSADIRSIAISSPIPAGTAFTAQVFYHGTPPGGSGFFTHALNHYTLGSGTDITFSLSDPFLAKEWWPCKQSLTDKIDSADIWLTVPNSTKAGSNGVLQATTPVGSSSTRWQWKTRYPIDYYLICASVAPYVAHTQMLHFSGSSDSMPILHYVYDTASFNPVNGKAIDSVIYMVDYLSTLYGRYPFWKEKYGHCIAPLGGGMEHQTMTTLGAFTTPLIAHELGHQWWGDCVTYGTWRDIWLSEGFASYTEQLYVEHFWGVAAARAYRTPVFNSVTSAAGGTVDVDDTTSAIRIFDTRLTYNKGAAIVHMLRYLAPNDAAFFSGLQNYQQQYAFKTATTADFRAVMEAAYGRRLDTFFNQWIYGEGFPIYTPVFNQRGQDVYVQLSQTTSRPTSVAAFALPVALRLVSATSDTIVKVYLAASSGLYHFTWSQTVTDVVVDPLNDIVNRAGLTNSDPTLGVSFLPGSDGIIVAPNPTGSNWTVSGIAPGSVMQLTDITGKLVAIWEPAPAKAFIDGNALPAGVYTLRIDKLFSAPVVRKLVKQ